MAKTLTTLLKPYKEKFQPDNEKIKKAFSDIEYTYQNTKQRLHTPYYKHPSLALTDCLKLDSEGYELVEMGAKNNGSGCTVAYIKPYKLQEIEIKEKQEKWLSDYNRSLEEIKLSIVKELSKEQFKQKEIEAKVKLEADNEALKKLIKEVIEQ